MEKIKKILSPGSSKDDEVLYGSGDNTTSNTGTGTGSSNTGGLSGQGSHFGTATTSSGAPQLQSNPASEQDDSMLSNPSGYRGDNSGYGSTSSADPNAVTAARTAGTGTGNSSSLPTGLDRGSSAMSLKSGIEGPYSRTADDASTGTSGLGSDTSKALPNEPGYDTTGGSGLTGRSLPDRSVQGNTGSSHLGRDAGLAGAGAAGVGAYEYERNENRDGTSGTSNDRSFPLGGGSTSSSRAYDDPSSRTGGTTGAGDNSYNNSTSRSGLGNTSGGLDDGRAGLASAATGAGAGGLAGSEFGHEHGGHGHKFDGHRAGEHETPVEGYPHMTSGPHATDTANRLDPHIPGEYPTESGQDRHFGRDAALAGGAGAGGLGAYEAEKHGRDSTLTSGTGAGYGTTSGGSGGSYPSTSGSGNNYSNTDPSSTSTGSQHHYGRDAALAGGAGAAGVGAYELEKGGRGDTGPASKTIGPHSSNLANVVDPRVKPDPAKMNDHSNQSEAGYGSGNYASNTESSSQHHYGRDAALAGGAGAAGAGGLYEAEKHRGGVDPSTGASSTGYPSTTSGSATGSGNYPSSQTTDQHHYGRDAALGGAGVAGLGGAAYEADKHRGGNDPLTGASSTGYPSNTGSGDYSNSRATDPTSEHHYGRDAALGGAGVAGLGGGAYEAEKSRGGNDPSNTTGTQRLENERPESQHHYGRDAAAVGGVGAAGYAADKEYDQHHAKELEKARQKEAAKAEKAHEKDEKKHEKAIAKDEKKHEKQEEKLEKKHDKEVAKEEKPKKEGFLHKILHPGEKHQEEETGRPKGLDYKDADEANHARHARELEAAGAGGALGVGGAGYEAGQSHGVDVAHDASGHNKLHKDPPAGYGQDSRAIDPHTGLPVDLSKGTGQGGTDGATQLHGIHDTGATMGTAEGAGSRQGAVHHAGEEGVTGPDWDKIKKANTPY